MSLDAGGAGELNGLGAAGADGAATPARAEPSIHDGTDLGGALRAIREHRALSVEALAERTRVRASYITAIEEMRFEGLPSRPFIIGYIRAMAQALGVDPEAAAHRFKAEEPVLDEPLPEPVGVGDDKDPRLAAIIAAGFVIVAAIVVWNVVQRVMTETAPAPPTAPETVTQKALANTTSGPVSLGAPLPAPVESTTPPPYITPGLDKAVNAEGQPLIPQTAEAPPSAVEANLAATFQPKGQVYGAASGAVVVQALKPAFLVVHGGDGSVYFARQLNEGEAYRAPAIAGLTVDVSDPGAFQVFVGGLSKGLLTKPLTDVSALPSAAAPPPAKPASPNTAASKPVTGATPGATVKKPDGAKTTGVSTAKPSAAKTGTATASKAPKAAAKKPAAVKPDASKATVASRPAKKAEPSQDEAPPY